MLKIFTFAHKRPDFIELQCKSFDKYLQEPHEFVVFNNAVFDKSQALRIYIDATCVLHGIESIPVERDKYLTDKYQSFEPERIFNSIGEYYNANIACAYPLCWAWEKIISKEKGPILILDSDMFLLHPIMFTDLLQRYDIGYLSQSLHGSPEYMWNGIFLADMGRLDSPETINWWCGLIKGTIPVDVGGQTFRYLETHQELRRLRIIEECIESDLELLDLHIQMLRLEDRRVLHYRAGSNWNCKSEEYHIRKTAWIKKKIGLC